MPIRGPFCLPIDSQMLYLVEQAAEITPESWLGPVPPSGVFSPGRGNLIAWANGASFDCGTDVTSACSGLSSGDPAAFDERLLSNQ
jgi:hypothetical protein